MTHDFLCPISIMSVDLGPSARPVAASELNRPCLCSLLAGLRQSHSLEMAFA